MRTFFCQDCGLETRRTGANQVRCHACAIDNDKKWKVKSWEEFRAKHDGKRKPRRKTATPRTKLPSISKAEALRLALTQFTYEPETGDVFRTETGEVVRKLRDQSGYERFYFHRHTLSVHRFAFLQMTGTLPSHVDHANRKRSDNRWCNLREATPSQNVANRPPTNAHGIKGIWRERGTKNQKRPWRAAVCKDGKQTRLGYFATAEEASDAYRKAAKIIHGEFAYVGEMGDRATT